jgi:hypothetical protein
MNGPTGSAVHRTRMPVALIAGECAAIHDGVTHLFWKYAVPFKTCRLAPPNVLAEQARDYA